MGIAAAAMLTIVAASAPAKAAAIRHAPGIQVDQSNVQEAQWRRGRHYRRHWRGHRYYRGYRHWGYRAPYAYAPYPYYRRRYYEPYYYGSPGPYVRLGPFAFGVW